MSQPAAESVILDFDGWLGQQAPDIRGGIESHLSVLPEANRGQEKQRLASMFAVSQATGLDMDTVADKWGTVRGGYAEQQGGDWLAVKDDEAAFFGKLKEQAVKGKDERELLIGPDEDDNSEGRAESLVFRSWEAAFKGRPHAEAYIEWVEAHKHRPGFDPAKENQYVDIAAKEWGAINERITRARPIAEQAVTLMKDYREGNGGDMSPAALFRGMDPEDKQIAFRLMGEQVKGSNDKGGTQAFFEAVGRGFENLGPGASSSRLRSELIRKTYRAGDSVTSGDPVAEALTRVGDKGDPIAERGRAIQKGFSGRQLTSEEAKDWNERAAVALEDLDTREQLRKFGQELDSTKGDDKTWKGYLFNKLALPLADSAALMATLAIPGAWPASLELGSQAYANDAYMEFRAQGMEAKEADSLAGITGAAQAALDKLQLGLLTKGLPNVTHSLERFAMSGRGATRFLANTAATAIPETGIELVQDHIIPALVLDNLATNPAFDQDWGKVWTEAAKAAPDTFLGMLLLSGGGGAFQTLRDSVATKQLAGSKAAMRLRGYSLEQIEEIQAAPDETKGELLSRYLPTKAPRGEERTALVAESVQLQAEERASFEAKAKADAANAMEASDVARVVKRGNRWEIQTADGKASSVDSAEAARRIRDDLKQSSTKEEAASLVRLIDEWTAAAPEGVAREVALTGEAVGTDGQKVERRHINGMLDVIEDGSFSAEAMEELRRETSMLGAADWYGINGTNQFKRQVVNGASQLVQVLEINRSRSAVETFLHEAVESEFRRTGSGTDAQRAIAAMRGSFDPQKAPDEETRNLFSMVQKVADGKASETELREVFSELAVADYFGRPGIEPGAMSRSVDAALNEAADRQVVEGLSKIRSILRAVKAYFRALFATVSALRKAKRSGTGQEFEALVSKLLGIQEQETYDESLSEEVGEYVEPTEEEQAAGIAFSLSKLTARFANRGVKIEAKESKSGITLSNVEVREGIRGNGMGSEAMRELTAYADRSGKPMVLAKNEAPEFFAKFGFEDGKRQPGVPAFSISAGSRLELTMKRLDAALAKDPAKRRELARQANDKLEALAFNWEQERWTPKGDEIRPLVARMSQGEINKAAALMRERRDDELTADVYRTHGEILSKPDLATIWGGKVMQQLQVNAGRRHGRIMGKTRALETNRIGEDDASYNGSEELPKMIFGGSLTPEEAAQELFEVGIINDPDVGAMWRAIEDDIADAAVWQQFRKEAKADLRAARELAKQEAEQWKADREAEQAKDWSPKARLIRDLRTLDAILSVMPAEVRGKVGGFVKLAQLGTDKARAEEIGRRIEKLGALVESHLQKESTEALEALLAKAQPKGGPGERPGGKIGVEGHRIFLEVDRVWQMTEEEKLKEEAALAAAIDEAAQKSLPGVVNPALIDLLEKQEVFDMFAAFEKKPAAEMDKAVSWLQEVYTTGRNLWRAVEEQRAAEIAEIQAAILEVNGDASLATREDQEEASRKVAKMLENGSLDLLSFVQVLETMLPAGHPLVKRWNQAARAATAQKTDAILSAEARFQDATKAAMGGTRRERQRRLWDMATKRSVTISKVEGGSTEEKTAPIETIQKWRDGLADPEALGFTEYEADALIAQLDDPGIERKKNLSTEKVIPGTVRPAKITEAKAIALTMLAAQEQYRENMQRHGYTAEVIEEAEAGISEAGKRIRSFLWQEYRNGHAPLATLFRQMFGIDLAMIANYSPGTFYTFGKERDMDPFGGGLLPEGGMRAGMLRNRKPHLAEPRLQNAITLWRGHVSQTEHWKAFAPFVRELKSVFGNVGIKNSIRAKHGEEMLGAIERKIEAFENNGLHERAHGKLTESFAREITRRQATLTLAWKTGTALKNLILPGINSMARMPAGEWFRGLGRVLRGKVDVKAIWNDPIIQRRILSGYSPEQRAAMASLFAGKPGVWRDFLIGGLELHAQADAFSTSLGTAIAFDYHFRQAKDAGLSDTEARAQAIIEAEDNLGRTAQPTELMDRSNVELAMSPVEKMLFMFASNQRKDTALILSAVKQWKAGKITAGEMTRTLAVIWFAAGLGSAIIGAAWRDAQDDDDDAVFDWEHWNPFEIAASVLLGPLGGIPIANLLSSAAQGYTSSGPFQPVARAIKASDDLLDGDKTEPVEKTVNRVVDVANGAAMLLPQVEAFAVTGNIFKQVFNLVDNFAPDSEEEAEKKERAATRREQKEARGD